MASMLLLSTGVFLFLWHASDTFAWSSNDNYLDNDFWDVDWDGSSGMLIDALYGNGDIGTDTSYYTQYWQTNTCDVSAMDMVLVSP